MTNQSTIDKLIEMWLTAMADAFRNHMDDPKYKDVPFEDHFGMLVDIEHNFYLPRDSTPHPYHFYHSLLGLDN